MLAAQCPTICANENTASGRGMQVRFTTDMMVFLDGMSVSGTGVIEVTMQNTVRNIPVLTALFKLPFCRPAHADFKLASLIMHLEGLCSLDELFPKMAFGRLALLLASPSLLSTPWPLYGLSHHINISGPSLLDRGLDHS